MSDGSLEPTLQTGDLRFFSMNQVPRIGHVAAVKDVHGTNLVRLFARGPVRIKCYNDAAFRTEVLVPFEVLIKSDGSRNQVHTVREFWESQPILIKRRAHLVPPKLSESNGELEVENGHWLVGCQNRVLCEGCGFRQIPEGAILGTMVEFDVNAVTSDFFGKLMQFGSASEVAN